MSDVMHARTRQFWRSQGGRLLPPWLVLAFLVPATLCCFPESGIAAPARHGMRQDAAILVFRHYALSSCLRQAFPAIADETDAAKDAYIQFGSHPAEAYMAIQSMAAEWLKRPYVSFRGANLSVMACIDFAESPAVGSLARRTLPRTR